MGDQTLCIFTHRHARPWGWAVALCYKTQILEVDLITRGRLKVDYKEEMILEPRKPGRGLHAGIMSDLF